MQSSHRQLSLTLCTLGLALAAAPACQRDSAPAAAPQSTAAHSANAVPLKIANLFPFDVVSGNVPLRAEVAPGTGRLEGLEFWINDKVAATLPASSEHSWETSSSPDGLATLLLKATSNGRQLASEPMTVVVLNKGGEVFFKNGSNGTVEAPATGAHHQHLRFHWDQPTPSRKILALLTWTDSDFELELALGTGVCPHHGIEKAKAHGTRSPLLLVYEPAAGESFSTGQWFAHLRLLNPERVAGRQAPFEIRAFKLD